MKLWLRKISIVLVCIAIVFSIPTSVVQAIEWFPGPTEGETQAGAMHLPVRDVEYYNPTQLIRVSKESKECVLTFIVNGNEEKFYISFPTVGGFRFRTDDKGFFDPKELQKVKYSYDTENNLLMDSSDGTTVRLLVDGTDWEIQVYNKNRKCLFSIKSKQIAFGIRDNEVKQIVFEMPLASKEVIYGGGERFADVNLVGTSMNLTNTEAQYHTENKNTKYENAYKNIPIFHSNRGYMLFFNSTYMGTADIGKTNSKKYTLTLDGPTFDFYLWTGMPADSISKYSTLTGNTIVPPKWALRYWAGGAYKLWLVDEEPGTGYTGLMNYMNNYAKLGTANISAIYVEGEPRNNPACYNLLNRTNTKMLIWNVPFAYENEMTKWLPGVNFEDQPIIKFPYATPLSYSNWIDFTHPLAADMIKGRYAEFWDWGCRGLMIDVGEYIPEQAIFYNGKTGDEMHNLYQWYYSKTMSEVFTEQFGDDYILFARSACAGSQAFTAVFGGDQLTTFRGMKNQLNGILSLSSCGVSLWGGDIGGISGIPTSEVYTRWLGFGTFSPLMRAHNYDRGNDPWHFGNVAEAAYKQYYWFRENMLDNLYSHTIRSSLTGQTMVQNLAVAFPNEKNLTAVGDQYLFCNDMLVSPVITGDTYYRPIALPNGSWYSLWTKERVSGGQTINLEAPLTQIPVYLREGTTMALTLSKNLELFDNFENQPSYKGLLVTPPDNSRTTTIYEDKENSVTYTNEKISSSTFEITASKATDRKAVLLHGVTASSVTVDGKKLERSTEKFDASNATESGYYVDRSGKTVVYLTDNWKTISVTKGTTNYVPLKITPDEQAANVLIDNDITTSCIIKDSISFALEKEQEIDAVVLKWTDKHPAGYSVQVSVDGTDWKTVATQESIGGIETVQFTPVLAKYIRITDIVNSEGVYNNMLYEFAVYAPDDYKTSVKYDDYEYEQVEDEWQDDPDFDYESEDEGTTKKIIKKYFYRKGENGISPLVLGALITAAVLVVGVTIFIIIFIKRRKNKDKVVIQENPKE